MSTDVRSSLFTSVDAAVVHEFHYTLKCFRIQVSKLKLQYSPYLMLCFWPYEWTMLLVNHVLKGQFYKGIIGK